MSKNQFIYIWQYQVKPERLNEFIRAYGPEGEWVRLFRKASGYLSTELLRDPKDPHVFLTIDRWESVDACRDFRSAFADEFQAVDRMCEEYTLEERHLGEYEVQAPDVAD